MTEFSPIKWIFPTLKLLDQRVLPDKEEYVSCHDAAETAQAIANMVVRGAPAIGVTAAWGLVLSAIQHQHQLPELFRSSVLDDLNLLAQARPTAINLAWALDRMWKLLEESVIADNDIVNTGVVKQLEKEAQQIHRQDIKINHTMGDLGAQLISKGSAVLTHCNAGALATGGYGTALGVIRSAYRQGNIDQVYADETRPWLQGSRLTAWELQRDDISVHLIADSAAAYLMRQKKIQWVIVGADRVAANGDVANKIGTYSLAVNARHHGIKFMVVAPTSTIDFNTISGEDIPVEQRDPNELLNIAQKRIAAIGAKAWNPVFDITPANLIDVLVTEKGIIKQPNSRNIRQR